MIALIITIVLSLGINIYQTIKVSKVKTLNRSLFSELAHEKDHAEISRTVIANLLNKVEEINKKYTDLRSDKSTSIVIEDVPVKKTRTKK